VHQKVYQKYVDQGKAAPLQVGVVFQDAPRADVHLGLNYRRHIIEWGYIHEHRRLKALAATEPNAASVRPTIVIRGVTLVEEETR
jgi:hypothetical protein